MSYSPISELKIPIIVGPTAIGKSSVAMEIAEKFGYEIISADSRQMVREMSIGTAKPSPEDMKKIIHHFIDIIDPTDDIYNSYIYGNEVREELSNIYSQGKKALICGGSGLYIQSAVHGFFEDIGIDDNEKLEYRKELERSEISDCYEILKNIDPEYAQKTPSANKQRIHRALEVYHFTGRKISELHSEHKAEQFFQPVYIGLNAEREKLFENINTRVIKMINSGLIEEVEGLVQKFGSELKRFKKTIGYKEVIEFLKGDITKDIMIELIKTNTRHFAKRQITWFKRIEGINWFEL
ncbi:MAG: tRNA (adenosine(37)-N6)-dimethylallyltransferase MiaA [Candidatus Delongbacteria bacterium]|nr:tRNA (adenosine(37)-N6)-dimethylallyltransferase MiaA [Candidatus Delongbacteria bacterium]MCG2761047.1 tRNA (adenosine(37)-N6)-dimethylallyltransferase MiaA [Candidatus Delongbacteria bacterium]